MKRLLLTLICLCTTYTLATASIFYVKKTGNDSNTGKSWATAWLTLQKALDVANSGDQIWVAEGIYFPDEGANNTDNDRTAAFQIKSGVAVYGGFFGLEVTLSDRISTNTGTILSGDLKKNDAPNIPLQQLLTDPSRDDNAYHVVVSTATENTTLLDGLTITGGNANSSITIYRIGGGMFNRNGNLVLTNCIFKYNAAISGGGIENKNSSPTLDHCLFFNNYADNGAGIFNELSTKPKISNCEFSENFSINGAGIYNDIASQAVIDNSSFNKNKATSGAGIYNLSANPSINGCTFYQNSASSNGGGITNQDVSSVFTIRNCTFTENSASNNGGGMYNTSAIPFLKSCLFERNIAKNGGGIFNTNSSPRIESVIFNDNHVTINGGGISNIDNSSPNIIFSTFTSNTSMQAGGGMANGQNTSPNIISCNFSGNKAEANSGGMDNNLATVNLVNCFFHGNLARLNGGGMGNTNGSVTIANCSFSSNKAAGSGAGLSNSGLNPIINNTIIWNNIDKNGIKTPTASIFNSAATPTISYSIIGNSRASGSNWQSSLGTDAGKNLDVDPLFVKTYSLDFIPIVDGDLRLQNSSPAIDVGNTSALPKDIADLDNDGDFNEQVPLDFDGQARVSGSNVNLGAFETTCIKILNSDLKQAVCEGVKKVLFKVKTDQFANKYQLLVGDDAAFLLNSTPAPIDFVIINNEKYIAIEGYQGKTILPGNYKVKLQVYNINSGCFSSPVEINLTVNKTPKITGLDGTSLVCAGDTLAKFRVFSDLFIHQFKATPLGKTAEVVETYQNPSNDNFSRFINTNFNYAYIKFIGKKPIQAGLDSLLLQVRDTTTGCLSEEKKLILKVGISTPKAKFTIEGINETCEGLNENLKLRYDFTGGIEPYNVSWQYSVTKIDKNCKPVTSTQTPTMAYRKGLLNYIDLTGESAGVYKINFQNLSDSVGCSIPAENFTLKIASKPIGRTTTKNAYNQAPANINLQKLVDCNTKCTFTWYTVQFVGSTLAYDYQNVNGESSYTPKQDTIISDVLTNLTGSAQTLVYRVLPVSLNGCIGDPFYVTVNLQPVLDLKNVNFQCGKVNLTLDQNCQFNLKAEFAVFAGNSYTDFVSQALELVIHDGNDNGIVDCTGIFSYDLRIKKGFENTAINLKSCTEKILSEDKSSPRSTVNVNSAPLFASDIPIVLNNPKTIGDPGTIISPDYSATTDDVKNLGQVLFKDNCASCGCSVTTKWSDKIVYYPCDSLKSKRIPQLYATIFRTWTGIDCYGNDKIEIQQINFIRPPLSAFQFLDDEATNPSDGKPYAAITTYSDCATNEGVIKEDDYLPYVTGFFGNKTLLSQVKSRYSIAKILDTRSTNSAGEVVQIDRKVMVYDSCLRKNIDSFRVLIKFNGTAIAKLSLPNQLPIVLSTDSLNCTASLNITQEGIQKALSVNFSGRKVSKFSATIKTRGQDYRIPIRPETPWFTTNYPKVNNIVSQIPIGQHRMIISAFDSCTAANTVDSFDFFVADRQAPVFKISEKQHKAILTNDIKPSYASLSTDEFTSEVSDNCGLSYLLARRAVPKGSEKTFLDNGYDTNNNGKLDTLDGFDYNLNGKLEPLLLETFRTKNGQLMTPLRNKVDFFCFDAEQLVPIELWGIDSGISIFGLGSNAKPEGNYNVNSGGNFGFAIRNIKVEDFALPAFKAPDNTTIDCDDKNIATIDSEPNSKTFGGITFPNGNECANVDITYNAKQDIQCGTGTITRIWTITKKTATTPITGTGKQVITVRGIHSYNILFPKDVRVNDLKTLSDTLVATSLNCELLAISSTDKRYDATGSESYQIYRTYSVINWCLYDDRCGSASDTSNVYVVDRKWGDLGATPFFILVRDENRDQVNEFYFSRDAIPWNFRPNTPTLADGLINNDGNDEQFFPTSKKCPDGKFTHSWMYTQIIKIYTNQPPVVNRPSPFSICSELDKCSGSATISFRVANNCFSGLELARDLIKIALYQTGTPAQFTPLSDIDPNWRFERVGNYQDSFSISIKNIPLGVHNLVIVMRDKCGSSSTPIRVAIEIRDCDITYPVCKKTVEVSLTSNGKGGAEGVAYADDFIKTPIYDCTGQGPENEFGRKLITKYSINRLGRIKNANGARLNLSCVEAGKTILVEIHCWDEAGNDNYTLADLKVTDPLQLCTGSNNYTGEIGGSIKTEANKVVQGVEISLSGNASDNYVTAADGSFTFLDLEKGYDYTVAPGLNSNPLNGVNTADLIAIQKHLMGITKINGAYKLIAADVNNSKSITTQDVVQLRNMILGIETKFKNNRSWRFVETAYKFPKPTNPWFEIFPEITNVNNLNAKLTVNFVAIKVGDVDISASANESDGIKTRHLQQTDLTTEELELKPGLEYTVPFRMKDLAQLEGYQFTMEYDPKKVELIDLGYGLAKAEHFAVFQNEGIITTSWNRPINTLLDDDAILFSLKLQAKTAVMLSDLIKVTSRYTQNEAYNLAGENLSLALNFGHSKVSEPIPTLLQNRPNPFSDQTQIDFFLPQATEGCLTIHDAKGAIVYRLKANYNQGWNQAIIKQSDIKATGVLYYTLETPDFTATKKMVLINR